MRRSHFHNLYGNFVTFKQHPLLHCPASPGWEETRVGNGDSPRGRPLAAGPGWELLAPVTVAAPGTVELETCSTGRGGAVAHEAFIAWAPLLPSLLDLNVMLEILAQGDSMSLRFLVCALYGSLRPLFHPVTCV